MLVVQIASVEYVKRCLHSIVLAMAVPHSAQV